MDTDGTDLSCSGSKQMLMTKEALKRSLNFAGHAASVVGTVSMSGYVYNKLQKA